MVHSLLAHKEFRFLFPVLPMAMHVCGVYLHTVCDGVTEAEDNEEEEDESATEEEEEPEPVGPPAQSLSRVSLEVLIAIKLHHQLRSCHQLTVFPQDISKEGVVLSGWPVVSCFQAAQLQVAFIPN